MKQLFLFCKVAVKYFCVTNILFLSLWIIKLTIAIVCSDIALLESVHKKSWILHWSIQIHIWNRRKRTEFTVMWLDLYQHEIDPFHVISLTGWCYQKSWRFLISFGVIQKIVASFPPKIRISFAIFHNKRYSKLPPAGRNSITNTVNFLVIVNSIN